MGSEYDLPRDRRKKLPVAMNIRTVQEGHQFIDEDEAPYGLDDNLVHGAQSSRGQQRRGASQPLGGKTKGSRSPLREGMGPAAGSNSGQLAGRGGIGSGETFLDGAFDRGLHSYSGELLPRSATGDVASGGGGLRGRGDSKAVKKASGKSLRILEFLPSSVPVEAPLHGDACMRTRVYCYGVVFAF